LGGEIASITAPNLLSALFDDHQVKAVEESGECGKTLSLFTLHQLCGVPIQLAINRASPGIFRLPLAARRSPLRAAISVGKYSGNGM